MRAVRGDEGREGALEGQEAPQKRELKEPLVQNIVLKTKNFKGHYMDRAAAELLSISNFTEKTVFFSI